MIGFMPICTEVMMHHKQKFPMRKYLVTLIVVGILTILVLMVFTSPPPPDYLDMWVNYCTVALDAPDDVCIEEYVLELRRPLRYCHNYAWAPFQHSVDYHSRVAFCLESK